jgi:CheY-like chemotaxis protein
VGEGELPPQDLAAAIHETTNALTVILGWIERAREATRLLAEEATPARIAEAETALDRAGRYTEAARAAMRRVIGADVPESAPESAHGLAARALEDLAVAARHARVELELVAPAEAGRAFAAQPDAAWQILTNLLLNALAVSPAGERVTLEVEAARDRLLFRVRDRGPGVAPELRAGLFEAGVSRREGGAGIGLRHAHRLAADHDGELRLIVEESERGACFELGWPRATTPATPSRAPGESRSTSAGKLLEGARVLLLEDDHAVVELLELSLGARGAVVTSVNSAAELDAELDQRPFDVLLVDLSPLSLDSGPSSLDAAVLKARSYNPKIDVVVISGSVTVQPRADVLWVRKPFEPRELMEAIARCRRDT